MKKYPILCLDFDGVIHQYSSPWVSASHIPDPPVDGALEFIRNAQHEFEIHIYSSRSRSLFGRRAMKKWLMEALVTEFGPHHGHACFQAIHWPFFKPSAFLTLDDRAQQFTGQWPDPYHLLAFRPWNKQ